MAWSTSLTFATEAGAYRKAGIVLSATTTPSGGDSPLDSEEFARDVASFVVLRTAKAGSRVEPSPSGSGDVFLDRLLQDANEVGAAFRIRAAIYARTKDRDDLELCGKLLAQWETYMGEGAGSAGDLGTGAGGLIELGIETIVNRGVMSSDVTTGDTTLKVLASRAVGPVNSTAGVD